MTVAVPLHEGIHYWSSSEYSSFHAYNVNTYNGYMNNNNKNNNNYVRAFRLLRIWYNSILQIAHLLVLVYVSRVRRTL